MSQLNYNDLPKNVFLLWFQGWKNAPWLQTQVRKSWEINNPNWNIILLDDKNLKDYINDIDYIYDESKKISLQAKSDIIRLSLLKNIGGVWADSTLLCMQPLDNWVNQAVETSGFWMYHGHGAGMPKHIGPASWFIVSKKNNYVLQKWKEECDKYWKNNNSTSNYYWMDGLFKKLHNEDENFKNLWYNVPYLYCEEMGSCHTLAHYKVDGNNEQLKTIFANNPPYALKFWGRSRPASQSHGLYAIHLALKQEVVYPIP